MNRLENLKYIIENLLDGNSSVRQIPVSVAERQRLMRILMNVWQPRSVGSDLLSAQDRELQLQKAEKGVVTPDDIKREGNDYQLSGCNAQLLLWQGDITRLQADAVVNAANSQALGCWSPLHNCIDNCIHSAAGIQLRKECADIMQGGRLATGEAFVTNGYNLPARHVIHTVGPIIADGEPNQEQKRQLADCYRNCLAAAEKNCLASIAFCCISTGIFRFPNQQAAEIAVETVRTYPLKSVKTIIFNVFLDKDYDIYRQLLAKD